MKKIYIYCLVSSTPIVFLILRVKRFDRTELNTLEGTEYIPNAAWKTLMLYKSHNHASKFCALADDISLWHI